MEAETACAKAKLSWTQAGAAYVPHFGKAGHRSPPALLPPLHATGVKYDITERVPTFRTPRTCGGSASP